MQPLLIRVTNVRMVHARPHAPIAPLDQALRNLLRVLPTLISMYYAELAILLREPMQRSAHLLPKAVHDPALVGVAVQDIARHRLQRVLRRRGLGQHRVVQVFPVQRRGEVDRAARGGAASQRGSAWAEGLVRGWLTLRVEHRLQAQDVQDVGAHLGRARRGEAEYRHAREEHAKLGELLVVWAAAR